jgi:O-acetyl-ADP-ribose deacetylase (regulator of RNase III)
MQEHLEHPIAIGRLQLSETHRRHARTAARTRVAKPRVTTRVFGLSKGSAVAFMLGLLMSFIWSLIEVDGVMELPAACRRWD